ncbi:MAG: hypothetical protein WBK20_15925 [Spirochaetota bacterium]
MKSVRVPQPPFVMRSARNPSCQGGTKKESRKAGDKGMQKWNGGWRLKPLFPFEIKNQCMVWTGGHFYIIKKNTDGQWYFMDHYNDDRRNVAITKLQEYWIHIYAIRGVY